jgi:DNA-binding GntR family transcriptional regulator
VQRRPDPSSGWAQYRRIAADLRDAVLAGELQPGQLLPPEPALADRYDTSVDVIRSALAVLRQEGLIVTQQGRGSKVREAVEVTAVRVPPGARISARMPTLEERDELGLPEGVPLLVVEHGGRVEVLPADRFAVDTIGLEPDK